MEVEGHRLFEVHHEKILGQVIKKSIEVFIENKLSFEKSVPIAMTAFLHITDKAISEMVLSVERRGVPEEIKDNIKDIVRSNISEIIDSVRTAVSSELDVIQSSTNFRIDHMKTGE